MKRASILSTAIILLLCGMCSFLPLCSQTPQLWGLTSLGGGINALGTLFSVNGDGTNYNMAYAFPTSYTGVEPIGQPIFAANGKIYGTSEYGGGDNQGNIFSYDIATGVFTNVFQFYDTMGKYPCSTLMQASDGLLYGTTSGNGYVGSSAGALFSFNPATLVYTKLVNFGSTSTNLLEYHGKLYGTLAYNIFSYDINTHIYKVECATSSPSSFVTSGALVRSPYDSLLYGAGAGGTGGYGFIFSFNPANDSLKVIYNFGTPVYSGGANPLNDFVITSDSIIYGLKQGSVNYLYQYKIKTGIYSDLNFFPNIGNDVGGGLVLAHNNEIYGMISDQNIFSYNTQTHAYSNRINLNAPDLVQGGKACMGPDGRFYAFGSGGTYNTGILFSFSPDSTTYTKYFDFDSSTGCVPAAYGSLVRAYNGKLYGVLSEGGANNYGSIFSYDPATQVYSVVFNFNDSTGIPGWNPAPVLGRDGKLYGTTEGKYDIIQGVIYSFDPYSNTFRILTSTGFQSDTFGISYDSVSVFQGNGLTQLSNGKFYGIGWDHSGTGSCIIFSFDPDSLIMHKLAVFDTSVTRYDEYPFGCLAQANNGLLYCTNYKWIYSFNPVTDSIKDVYYFNSAVEGNATFSLLKANNGLLYGYTTQNGIGLNGNLFSFNPDSNTLDIGYESWDTAGNFVPGSLIQASDGNIYGLTQLGGIINGICSMGTAFSFNPVTKAYRTIHQFNYNTGFYPYGGLFEIPVCPTVGTNSTAAFCSGSNYSLGNKTYSAAGTYFDTLTTINGCDSIIILYLTANSVPAVTWNMSDTVITGNSPITLTGGLPTGGNYTGTGVSGNIFYPDSAGPGSYIITYTYVDTSGCSASSSITLNVVSGISQSDIQNSIVLYPNPANDLLIMHFNRTVSESAKPVLYDLTGKIIPLNYSPQADGITFNIKELAAGAYYIRFTVSNMAVCRQFVKVN